jgi:oxygen-independent coproporphyrinogen-3 oxidase
LQVEINCIGFEEFSLELLHLHQCFFEEVKIAYSYNEHAQIRETIKLTIEAHKIDVQIHIHDMTQNKTYETQTTRDILLDAFHPANIRALQRRIILATLLNALQTMTGIEQPWGILTGVRPTKLAHQLLKSNSFPEALAVLMENYLVSETKAVMLLQLAQHQLQVIPDLFQLHREISIYIGIPYCPTKCAYCTFPAYDIRGQSGEVSQFLQGLHDEIQQIGNWIKQSELKITTIYLGGGTPTSISADELDALFQSMHQFFPYMNQVREITVEAGRPDTITEEKIEVLKKWNVHRISVNPQSFTQQTLDQIGRHHSVEETIEKFHLARNRGLNNINMDLIIGLPSEGLTHLDHTLIHMEKLMPESVTIHTLAFKRASQMTQQKEQYEAIERKKIAQMMDKAVDWTQKNGYIPYYLYRQKNMLGNLENVGYAKPQYESLYNILMMEEQQTIIGLGCGAVSKIVFHHERLANEQQSLRIERFPNPKEPRAYSQGIQNYIDKKINLLNEAYHAKIIFEI